jgi:hypothetical protein
MLRPFALEAVMFPVSAVEAGEWNISYLLTEDDKSMPVQFQEWLIEHARNAGAKIEVDRMFCGHFPFLSKVKETASWIKRVRDGTS